VVYRLVEEQSKIMLASPFRLACFRCFLALSLGAVILAALLLHALAVQVQAVQEKAREIFLALKLYAFIDFFFLVITGCCQLNYAIYVSVFPPCSA